MSLVVLHLICKYICISCLFVFIVYKTIFPFSLFTIPLSVNFSICPARHSTEILPLHLQVLFRSQGSVINIILFANINITFIISVKTLSLNHVVLLIVALAPYKQSPFCNITFILRNIFTSLIASLALVHCCT